ncbi:hypothetical protein M513_09217 [Trichuris suis]|uniref:Major sperm protein n=1 Tax=Trichuris suis TaxID=68888 RepID=A0A085LY42_9BILA|nr:hypothetical protein M513_09217 [Trichuris suis]
MADDRTTGLIGYFDYCLSTMSTILRKKRFKFQVDMLLADMCNVPFVNAILYSKIRLLDGGNFCDHTNRADVVNHHIYWGKVSRFVCRISSCVNTGVLEPCICRISVRKEVKGGRSFQKLGYVDVNLSEFAGSGIDGLTRTYLLEGYNAGQQRQDNSLIRVNVSMVLLSSDPCFKVPQQWQPTATTSPEQPASHGSQERTVMGSDSASVTSVSSGFESLSRMPVQVPSETVGANLGPDIVASSRSDLRRSMADDTTTSHCRNSSRASQQSQMSDYPGSASHSRQSSASSSHVHRPGHGADSLAAMFPSCKGSAVKKVVKPDVNTVPEFDSSRVDAAELITELLKDYRTTADDEQKEIDSEQKAESIQLRNVSCKIFRPCRGKVHPKALEGTKQTFQQAKLATMTKLWDFFALSVTAFELHVWPGRKTNSFKPIDNNAERENAIILTHYVCVVYFAAVKLDTTNFKIKPSMKEDKLEKVRITNLTNSSVAFKVKSTRPKQLSAKPAYGIIKATRGTYLKVKFKKLPDPNFGVTKDRLTILVAIVPEGKTYNKPSEVWKGADGPPKNQRRIPIAIEYDTQVEMAEAAAAAAAAGKPEEKKEEGKKEEAKKEAAKPEAKKEEEEEEGEEEEGGGGGGEEGEEEGE